MLLKGVFDRPLSDAFQGEDHISITGQPITGNSKETVEKLLADESFPLRYQLQVLQRIILNELTKPKDDKIAAKGLPAIMKAAMILRDELVGPMDGVTGDWFKPYDADDDDEQPIDIKAESRPDKFGVPIATYRRSRPRSWVMASDPQDIFECIYGTSELLKEDSEWSWCDVCGVLGLWCIDEAISHIDAGAPYRAASWAIYAERYCIWQYTIANDERENRRKEPPNMAFSRRGLDARHAENRAVKQIALSMYTSKQWRSQADAARRIAPLVKRTEGIVQRWIREYKKNNVSPGTGITAPGK